MDWMIGGSSPGRC